MKCYLRIGDDSLDEAQPFDTKKEAVQEYRSVAEELGRFGQGIEASLHYAHTRDELAEYPDYVLSIGIFGGVKVEKA